MCGGETMTVAAAHYAQPTTKGATVGDIDVETIRQHGDCWGLDEALRAHLDATMQRFIQGRDIVKASDIRHTILWDVVPEVVKATSAYASRLVEDGSGG